MRKPYARLGLLPLLLSVYAGGAGAKDHLRRDELKVLAASSVAVVYMDSDQALEPYLDSNHRMVGITPATMIVADAVNTHRLNAFAARIAPYKDALTSFSLPQSTHQAVQTALASIPWLAARPWVETPPGPQDASFLREHAQQARTQIVIFIQPQLMMDPSGDALYLVSTIDIETANPPGANVTHYEVTEVTTSLDVDDAVLPPSATPPLKGQDDSEVRLARMFANDGEAFKKLYAELLQQSQQHLYYYFTGNKTLPPAAASHTDP